MAKWLHQVDGKWVEETVAPADGQFFSLEELQKFVGGYIELITLPDNRQMYMNEDGKSERLPPNPLATLQIVGAGTVPEDFVVGNVLIAEVGEIETDDAD